MRNVKLSQRQKAQVALLSANLMFWPELMLVSADQEVEVFQTSRTPIVIRELPKALQLMRQKGTSFGFSMIAARMESADTRVLLAVDQSFAANQAIGHLLPRVRQLLIAHGSIREENLRRHAHVSSHDGRTLCVWGEQDSRTYRDVFGDFSVKCSVVGSLRNAAHIQVNGLVVDRQSQVPLLFVSQFAGIEKEFSSTIPGRKRVLTALKASLARYCREHHLPLMIALRPPVSGTPYPNFSRDEVAHYREAFSGIPLTFTDPKIRYSTYAASDYADVTVGVPSGSLTESFARGNKVLMFGQEPGTGSYLGFPLAGPWLMSEPSYGEFSERLNELRKASRTQLASEWRTSRDRMVANAESNLPIIFLRQLLKDFQMSGSRI